MKKSMVPLLLVLLTGCAAVPQPDAPTQAEVQTTSPAVETDTAVPATEAETLPEMPVETAAASTAVQHVFDECGVLDDAALTHYDDYLEGMWESRMICAAVIITDALNGSTPEMYAQERYRELYGEESGYLVLINNDTNIDYVYEEGVCAELIGDVSLPIAQATPHLVECDYTAALDILLPIGMKVPELVYDRSGLFSAEQVQTLADIAAAVPERCCVLLSRDVPEPTEEETEESVLDAYAEGIRSRLNAGALLVIDLTHNRCVIAGTKPETLAAEVQQVWSEQSVYDAVVHYYDVMGGDADA